MLRARSTSLGTSLATSCPTWCTCYTFSPRLQREVRGRSLRALALGARGSQVRTSVAAVIAPGELDHPFLPPLRTAGVDVFAIPVPRRGYRQERAEVEQLCRWLRPDVVHTHGYRADVVDGARARRLGIPAVSTAHGFTGGDGKNQFYQWLQRRAWRRFDASSPCPAALERSGGGAFPRERLHYVQNAWYSSDPPIERGAACRALGIPSDGFRVAWVGRLSAEKGPDVLVEALPGLADVPVTASFMGAGPLRETLETRAARLRVADRIRWHGLVPAAGRLLRAFGAFVLTSRTEGTPIALLEAMAAEIPIVATRVGGVPDVVSGRGSAARASERPPRSARALREVFHNPDAARARASAARERLEHDFAFGPWLGRYEAVYRAVRRTPADGGTPAACAVLW